MQKLSQKVGQVCFELKDTNVQDLLKVVWKQLKLIKLNENQVFPKSPI